MLMAKSIPVILLLTCTVPNGLAIVISSLENPVLLLA